MNKQIECLMKPGIPTLWKYLPIKSLFLTNGKTWIYSVETGRHYFNHVFGVNFTSIGTNGNRVPSDKMGCQEHSIVAEIWWPKTPNRSLSVWKHETNSNSTKWMTWHLQKCHGCESQGELEECPRMRGTKETWPLSVTPFTVRNVFGTISQTWILYKN